MILRGIDLVSREAVHGGGCADIYKGALGNMLTALKVLRIFNKDDLKAVIRVWLTAMISHTDSRCPFTGTMQGSYSLAAA